MRLFTSLAYYVKLIQNTIIESLYFIFMVCLIIFSFANFFYVINENLTGDDTYLKNYFGEEAYKMNAIISVYMLGALGDFDADAFGKGYNGPLSMTMFILGTYVIQVIFMNMLICIMADTFTRVQEVSEASSMMEQVILINDHEFLVDLKCIFKGKKYMYIVSPEIYQQNVRDENFK